MTIQELFIQTNEGLKSVIAQIKDDQWKLSVPPEMTRTPATLEELVRYHTYDDAWVPDVLAGKTIEEVGDTYDYLRTPENKDVVSNYNSNNERANTVVRDFSDLEITTHLSYGDFPAKDFLQHIISFRAFHIYDIAKFIGVDTTMDPELVQALLDEFTPVIENYRKMGVFPPPVEVPEDASPQVKLLGLVGRQ